MVLILGALKARILSEIWPSLYVCRGNLCGLWLSIAHIAGLPSDDYHIS